MCWERQGDGGIQFFRYPGELFGESGEADLHIANLNIDGGRLIVSPGGM